jgi:hypothetical protein
VPGAPHQAHVARSAAGAAQRRGSGPHQRPGPARAAAPGRAQWRSASSVAEPQASAAPRMAAAGVPPRGRQCQAHDGLRRAWRHGSRQVEPLAQRDPRVGPTPRRRRTSFTLTSVDHAVGQPLCLAREAAQARQRQRLTPDACAPRPWGSSRAGPATSRPRRRRRSPGLLTLRGPDPLTGPHPRATASPRRNAARSECAVEDAAVAADAQRRVAHRHHSPGSGRLPSEREQHDPDARLSWQVVDGCRPPGSCSGGPRARAAPPHSPPADRS